MVSHGSHILVLADPSYFCSQFDCQTFHVPIIKSWHFHLTFLWKILCTVPQQLCSQKNRTWFYKERTHLLKGRNFIVLNNRNMAAMTSCEIVDEFLHSPYLSSLHCIDMLGRNWVLISFMNGLMIAVP